MSDSPRLTPEFEDPLQASGRRTLFVRVGIVLIVIIAIALGTRALMDQGPRESDRVRHPAGYSIVAPHGWSPDVVVQSKDPAVRDSITLSPDNWHGVAPYMWVKRLSERPDIAKLSATGFEKGMFGSRGAWISQSQPKIHLIRQAVFQDGENWFSVGIALPGAEGLKIDQWWRFALTFRPTS